MATAFRVILTGDQEVPTPTGSTARGLGTVIFDQMAVAACYSIRYTGLDFGPALGVPGQTPSLADDVISHHVHNAPRGVNGPVVFGQINPAHDSDDLSVLLNSDGSWTVNGRWETTDPALVSIATFANQLAAAQVGSDVSLYFNAHTVAFPAGEIRGQWVTIADEGNNTVAGTSDDDLLPGLGGNDYLLGADGNDLLQAGDGDDRGSGGNGDDRLEGGNGDDGLAGGDGNDLLLGGEGNDRLSGNAGDDRLAGGRGDDRMDGGDGNDRIEGSAGLDRLVGGNGDDRLEGGAGNDRLNGSDGNDLLIGGPGNDLAYGGSGDDRVIGNAGNDFLNGGLGTDALTGGLGFDRFIFNTALGGGNIDTIRDFRGVFDGIYLDNAVFTGLPGGALSGNAFRIGASANTADQRIIYDDSTGALYFDVDGSGGTAQVQFAIVAGAPDVAAVDFFVI